MPEPASILRLIEGVEALCIAIRRDLTPPEPEDDWITLRQAEVEFRRSNDTVRRWASVLGLGKLVEGRWLLSRNMTLRYLGTMHTHDTQSTTR